MLKQTRALLFLFMCCIAALLAAGPVFAGQPGEIAEEGRWETDGIGMSMRSSAPSAEDKPQGVFLMAKTRYINALSDIVNTGAWGVWDCYVDDPEQLLRSVTITGPGYNESLALYPAETTSFWSPRNFPGLAPTVRFLRLLAENAGSPGWLNYTFHITPKVGDSWTQTVSIDLSKLSDEDAELCLGAFSVKRDGVELHRPGRNRLLQVLSPEQGKNVFAVEWKNPFENPDAAGWKPDRARGRAWLSQYDRPGSRGRLEKVYEDFTGAPLNVDMDDLYDRRGEAADWRGAFIRNGAVHVFHSHPGLPDVLLVNTLELLPDAATAPEAIISKVYPRSSADAFGAPVIGKTARVGVTAYKTPDPLWETADVSFFLDGVPMKNVNQENRMNDMMVRAKRLGWTEDATLSGGRELAVELLYRNGKTRRIARTVNFDHDESRFPQEPQFTALHEGGETALKPDLPYDATVHVFAAGFPEDLLSGGATAGVEQITDSFARFGGAYDEWLQPFEGAFDLYFNLSQMAGRAINSANSWKRAFAFFRFNFVNAVSYDVRYELRSTGSDAAALNPDFSLAYRRYVPAKGDVRYSLMVRDFWLDMVSEHLVDSVTVSGPGYENGDDGLFRRHDGGSGMEPKGWPVWDPETFWTDVAPANTLDYTLTVKKKDGSEHTVVFSVDLTRLKQDEHLLRQSAQAVSVVRRDKELSLGEEARAGEYLHVLAPDNALNRFVVSRAAGETVVDAVRLRLGASVDYGFYRNSPDLSSQRLERTDYPVENEETFAWDPAVVDPSRLFLRGRTTDPQDWREWFLGSGELRVSLAPLFAVPVNGGVDKGGWASWVSILNALEILPDVMLRNTAEYREMHRPDETGTKFAPPVEAMQVYLNGTALPQTQGGERPVLAARFDGNDLDPSGNPASQMGSLATEETGVWFERHFWNPSELDGAKKLEVEVTYPGGAKRTIARTFELQMNSSLFPQNAALSYKPEGGDYAPVTVPVLWTGKESFRWQWEGLAGRHVVQTAVQSGGIRNNVWASWGWTAFGGEGPLSAELAGIPEDYYRVHPMLTHRYLGNIQYQTVYNILPVPATLTVNLAEGGPADGAWSVDGGATWHASGESLTLAPADYAITFRAVEGWDAPANIPVSLPKDGAVVKSAAYVQWTGNLTVTLNPAAGSAWSLDGAAWHNSGVTLVLRAGPSIAYRVLFREPAGYYRAEERRVALTRRNQNEQLAVTFRKIPVIDPEEKIGDDPDDNSGVLPVTPDEIDDINNGVVSEDIDVGVVSGDLEQYEPGKGEITPEKPDAEKDKESLEDVIEKDKEGRDAEPEVLKSKSFVIDAEGDTTGKFVPLHVEFKVTEAELDAADPKIRERMNADILSGTSLTEAFLKEIHIFKVIALADGERPVDLVKMVMNNAMLKDKLSRFFIVDQSAGVYTAVFGMLLMDGLPTDLKNLVQPLYTPSDDRGRFLVFDGTKDGKFTDPLLLAVPKPLESAGSSSSGGGCAAAGFSPFAPLLLAPLFLLKRKTR